MTDKEIPSPEMLRKLLSYDPERGVLRWKPRGPHMFTETNRWSSHTQASRWNSRYAGKEALSSLNKGYARGSVLGRIYSAHRVIWAIYYGAYPSGEIDHINGVKEDNRICNLRIASCSQNCANKPARGKQSKYKGVCRHRDGWVAQVGGDANRVRVYTKCETSAAVAYDTHAKILYGDFAYLNFPSEALQK